MTPARRRQPRGRGSRARANSKPVHCRQCRTLIVWAVVEEPDGSLRMNRDGRLTHVRLNAKTSPMGRYEYLRGAAGRPVVKELDELERLIPAETERYFQHKDVPVEER